MKSYLLKKQLHFRINNLYNNWCCSDTEHFCTWKHNHTSIVWPDAFCPDIVVLGYWSGLTFLFQRNHQKRNKKQQMKINKCKKEQQKLLYTHPSWNNSSFHQEYIFSSAQTLSYFESIMHHCCVVQGKTEIKGKKYSSLLFHVQGNKDVDTIHWMKSFQYFSVDKQGLHVHREAQSIPERRTPAGGVPAAKREKTFKNVAFISVHFVSSHVTLWTLLNMYKRGCSDPIFISEIGPISGKKTVSD